MTDFDVPRTLPRGRLRNIHIEIDSPSLSRTPNYHLTPVKVPRANGPAQALEGERRTPGSSLSLQQLLGDTFSDSDEPLSNPKTPSVSKSGQKRKREGPTPVVIRTLAADYQTPTNRHAFQTQGGNNHIAKKQKAVHPLNNVQIAVNGILEGVNLDTKYPLCHRCRKRLPEGTIQCTKLKGHVALKRCSMSFCGKCLSRFYAQKVEDIISRKTPKKRRAGHVDDATYVWECPVCEERCSCSICKKRQQAANQRKEKLNAGSSPDSSPKENVKPNPQKRSRPKKSKPIPPPSPPKPRVKPPSAHGFSFDFSNVADFLEVQQFLNRFCDILPGVPGFLPLLNDYQISGKMCLSLTQALLTFLLEAGHPVLAGVKEIRRETMWSQVGKIIQPGVEKIDDMIDWSRILKELAKSKSHRTIDFVEPEGQIKILMYLIRAMLDTQKMRDMFEQLLKDKAELDRDRMEELRQFRKVEMERRKELNRQQVALRKDAGDGPASAAVERILVQLRSADDAARAAATEAHEKKLEEFRERDQPPLRVSAMGVDREGNTYWFLASDLKKIIVYGLQWWEKPDQGTDDSNWFYFEFADVHQLIQFLRFEGQHFTTKQNGATKNLHSALITNLSQLSAE
ncbi:hypothetical protein HK097_002427 [Rhizophlyctis rosea]|uniref:Zinc-finger domain-containing protein n=1 Tax=Rhizophlyctis rosea TaxID=64517 RepID=A0AAD5SGK5_9FUNG|nr:hypothetical protein HK097_002427 [Rhizophlyctis rosea]